MVQPTATSGAAPTLTERLFGVNGPERLAVRDGRDPAAQTAAQLAAARAHDWETLRSRQREDHARLMSRVTIDLGTTTAAAAARPLDVRLHGLEQPLGPNPILGRVDIVRQRGQHSAPGDGLVCHPGR